MPSQAVLELLIELKDQASSGLASLGGALKTVGGVALGVAAGGVAAFGAAIVSGIGDAREAAQIMAQTEAVIKSTGGAAGVSAQQVADYSASLSAASGKSLFGDSQIQESENLLLTFTNIKTATLEAATAISVDMAQALGGAPKDSAIQLGKALNDPIAGITALTRVGVTFTEEQKEQIKTMQESGDMAGAQAVILNELNKEFGGSAQAAADADGGWAQFNDRMGEAAETVGGAILPLLTSLAGFLVDTVAPAIEAAATTMAEWLGDPAVQAGIDAIASAISDVLGAAFTFLSGTVIPALIAAWEAMRPAIDAVIGLFSGDVPAALDQTGETFTLLGETVQAAIDLIVGIIQVALPAIVQFWTDHGEQVMAVVKADLDFVISIVNTALTLLQGVFRIALDLINGDWSKAWEDLKQMSADVVRGIGEIVRTFLELIASLFGTSLQGIVDTWTNNWNMLVEIVSKVGDDLIAAGANVVSGILEGIKGSAGAILDYMQGLADDILKSFLRAIGAASPAREFMPAGRFLVQGILQGMQQLWPAVEDFMEESAIAAMNALTRNIQEGHTRIEKELNAMLAMVDKVMQQANQIIAAGFSATASIDRQVASNLDKLTDIVDPFYRQYTEGALAQAQKEAEKFLDPAQGAKWFKMRSDQILEFAKLQKELSEAATQQDRDRITKQMNLINAAQIAEIDAFNAMLAGQRSPSQQIIDQIQQIIVSTNAGALGNPILAQLNDLLNVLAGAQARALGGPVAQGAPYWVGERGPELFIPRTSGQIVADAGAAGLTINNTFHLPPGTPQQLADMVIAKLNMQIKGRR